MKKLGIVLLIACVYALHQDYFNWAQYKPLLFGFLPVGLWYHGAYALLCAALFYVLGKTVWPTHLEEVEQHASVSNDYNRGGH